jgi:2-dehydro-3-deoxygalactonokinase
MAAETAAIVVDWGTTSFRATLIDDGGNEMENIETPQGISKLNKGDYEVVLMTALAPWLSTHGALPIAALGMITSRNGWIEVPYVACPAGPAELAAGSLRKSLPNGSDLVFLPGLTDPSRRPFPDVMRGEEIQVAGHGLADDATIIIPGTHSKWIKVKAGRIDSFQTFVTGEIFALLLNNSFIARGATQPTVNDPEAYLRGLEEAKSSAAMLSLLFSARTGGLVGRLTADQLRSYVHGMVIGQEFRQAREVGWYSEGDEATIVGNDGLNDLYVIAATVFDLKITLGADDVLIRGALDVMRRSLS